MKRLIGILFALSLIMTGELGLRTEVGATEYDYTGVKARFTPFDSRYQRVQRYLNSRRETARQPNLKRAQGQDTVARLEILREYLKIASRFKYIPDGYGKEDTTCASSSNSCGRAYSSHEYWQLPDETEGKGAGDCEDKAIWLYARLIQMGFEGVRLVVGRYRTDQAAYHAWVVCYLAEKVYILDPTINDGLWEARRYPKGFYKPIYSYSRESRWCHTGGYLQLLANALGNRGD